MRLATIAAAIAFIALSVSAAFGAGGASEVVYKAGDTTLKGYLAKPSGEGKRPGVLVVHEWWGQNDYAKMRARMVADLGYVALAVDMYGDGVTTTDPKKAGELSGAIYKNPEVGIERFKAALAFLRGQEGVDPDRIAAIGYCFGGTTVLTAARAGIDLRGVVSFHGGLAPVGAPAAKGSIKGKVLVCHGGADPLVPKEQFDAFLQEMADSEADWQVSVYGKAKHSFTNPDADKAGMAPVGYDKTADERSWREMTGFLREVLAGN